MAEEIKIRINIDGQSSFKTVGELQTALEEATKASEDLKKQLEAAQQASDEKAAAKLTKQIDAQTKEINKLSKAIDSSSTAYGTLRNAQLELRNSSDLSAERIAFLTKTVNDSRESIKDIREASALGGSSFEKMGTSVSLLKDDLLNLDLEGAGQKLKLLGDSAKGLTFKEFKAGLASVGQGLASLGKALLTNPIFLLATVIAAAVTAMGGLSKALDGVSAQEEARLDAQKKTADASQEQLRILNEQDNILKLQGLSEEEILQKKIEASEIAKRDLKAQLETQRNLAKAQIETAERNQKIVKGILQVLTIPVQAVLGAIDLITEKAKQFGIISEDTFSTVGNLRDRFNENVSSLVFDPNELKENFAKTEKELNDAIRGIENTEAGYQLSLNASRKKAAEEAAKTAVDIKKKEIEEKKKLDEEYLAGLEKTFSDEKTLREKAVSEERKLREQAIADETDPVKRAQLELDNQRKIVDERLQLLRQQVNDEKALAVERRQTIESQIADQLALQKISQQKGIAFDNTSLDNLYKQLGETSDTISQIETQFTEGSATIVSEGAQAIKTATKDLNDATADAEKSAAERSAALKQLIQTDLQNALDARKAQYIEEQKLAAGNAEALKKIEEKYQADVAKIQDDAAKAEYERKVEQAQKIAGFVTQGLQQVTAIASSVSELRAQEAENQTQEIDNNLRQQTEAVTAQYQAQIEAASGNAEQQKALQDELQKALTGINSEAAKKKDAIARAEFERNKKAQVAQAVIAGAQGALQAFTGALTLGPIAGPIVGAALAAVVATTTALNIKKIKSTSYQGGDGGGGDNQATVNIPDVAASAQTPVSPVQFAPATGVNGQVPAGAGTPAPETQPIRVFVTESDITNTQNRVRVIENSATFGAIAFLISLFF